MLEPIAVSPVDQSTGGIGVSEQIYRNVRRAIMTGALPAGSRLNEQRMAEALKVSRIPLREALPRLEADGFVTSTPHRSAVVTGWSTTRVMDVFDARLAIEPEAMRLATIAVRTGASTERVEAAIADAEVLLASSTPLELAERHAELYHLMVNMAGVGLLGTFMRTLSHHMEWLLYMSPLPDPQAAYRELREVVGAIHDGDGELAKATMVRHISIRRGPALEAIDARMSEIPSSWQRSRRRGG